MRMRAQGTGAVIHCVKVRKKGNLWIFVGLVDTKTVLTLESCRDLRIQMLSTKMARIVPSCISETGCPR